MKHSFKKSLLLCASTVQLALVLATILVTDAFCALPAMVHQQKQADSLRALSTDAIQIAALPYGTSQEIDALIEKISQTSGHMTVYLDTVS